MENQLPENKEDIKKVPLLPGLWVVEKEGGEVPSLVATHCKTCGNIFFPSSKVCYLCVSDTNLETITLPGKGKLASYTAVKRGLPGYSTPYYLGSIDLENGPRVLFQLGQCTLDDLSSGMNMEAFIGVIRTDEDGIHRTGPIFRPSKNVHKRG